MSRFAQDGSDYA